MLSIYLEQDKYKLILSLTFFHLYIKYKKTLCKKINCISQRERGGGDVFQYIEYIEYIQYI